MSNPRIFLRDSFSLRMGHICSGCHNPVVSDVEIYAKVQKVLSELNQTKGEKIAKDALSNAIQEKIELAKNCKTTHSFLGKETDEEEHFIKPGLWVAAFYKGISVPCPNCGNIEPWQKKAGNQECLSSENYPDVFFTVDEANKWVNEQLHHIMKILDSSSTSNDCDLMSLTDEAQKLKTALQFAQQQYENLPEKAKASEVYSSYVACTKEISNLGAFNLKKRIELKKKSQALYKDLMQYKLAVNNAEDQLQQIYWEKRKRYIDIAPLVFGYSGSIGSYRYKNATCFFIEPNEPNNSQIISENESDNIILEKPLKDKFCKKCGNKLLPDSLFCEKCGERVD